LSAVKARDELAHIPVVLMTASVQSSYLEEGYSKGAADHIIKPFTVDDLRARVEKFASLLHQAAP
jgi:CheY-like chemotaxis protein